jgi:acetone carboxylase gamma subunit
VENITKEKLRVDFLKKNTKEKVKQIYQDKDKLKPRAMEIFKILLPALAILACAGVIIWRELF